ncbi:hypothetical protein TTHERM_000943049 (macronuclear) [Tetrahymena thermophila SB210]|uniref:Uncharacterized protein n=1 Tax=Tetrahymena thermophila (strain SB210) TaxID=312017 RepID=W7X8N3_TETTS|nr:hypothetical protein TTHERM_000943049 [Tetrahymena thermophila SB210]EWS75725.1 hypothetical protein TTHERM_000943049 [Tetrahymena thermophila SB210]|eukprot:XP_012651748.1 hypothetical protein TTHERM_000943049 [Tetrahymena thermophila SB210]
MNKEGKQAQKQSNVNKVKSLLKGNTDEEILNQILHQFIAKQQIIEQECSTRKEDYDKIILYMGQALQCLEVIDLNDIFRQKKFTFKANSLLQNTQLQDKMDVKITRRFENYMTEIQKRIAKYESYEEFIKKHFEQVEHLLQEIEQKSILTQLLNLEIDEPKQILQDQQNASEVQQQSKSLKNDKRDTQSEKKISKDSKNQDENESEELQLLKKNINKEMKNLCQLEEEYFTKLELIKDIKQNFTPFNSDDMRLEYWKKRVGIEI